MSIVAEVHQRGLRSCSEITIPQKTTSASGKIRMVRLEAQLAAEPLALDAGSDAEQDLVDLPWLDRPELGGGDRRLAGGRSVLDAHVQDPERQGRLESGW